MSIFVLALKLMLCWVMRGLLCNCRAISTAVGSTTGFKRGNSLSEKEFMEIERLLKLFKSGRMRTVSAVS